jgi:Protein of unknown function (DUF1822)
MSYNDLAPLRPNILLGDKAHRQAYELWKLYSNQPKALQNYIYVLCLLREAGKKYLVRQGFEVEEQDFSQWDSKNQSINDIGCVVLKNGKKVLFIPCSFGMERVSVPIEQQGGIVACILANVNIDIENLDEIDITTLQSLDECDLIGFKPDFQAEVELDQREDLEVFPEFLDNSITLLETSTVGEEIEITPPRTSLFPRITSGLRQLGEKLWSQDSTSDNSSIPSIAYTSASGAFSAASAAVSPTESTKYDREIDLGEARTVLLKVRIDNAGGGLRKVVVELKSLIDQGLPPQLELSIIGESDSKRRSTKENQRILQLNPYLKQPEDNPLIQIVLGDRVCSSFNLNELLIDESDATV